MAINNFLNIGTSWNTPVNWSLGTVPTSADVATFNASSGNCTFDAVINIGGLDIQATYINTISGGSLAVTVGGNYILAGGTFISTSGILKATRAFTISGGTFTHNSGTVELGDETNQSITTNGVSFNNLTFFKTIGGTSVVTLNDSFTVLGKITMGKTDASAFSVHSSVPITLTLKGDFEINSASAGTTTFGNTDLTLLVNGAGTQNFTKGAINTPSVHATFNFNSTGTMKLLSDFELEGDNIFASGTLDQNGFTLIISSRDGNTNLTTNGRIFADLKFFKHLGNQSSITLLDDFTVAGLLTVDKTDPSQFSIVPSGTRVLKLTGDADFKHTSGSLFIHLGNDDLTLLIAGASTQTVLSHVGMRLRANVQINATGTLKFLGSFRVNGNFEYIAGTIDQNGFDLIIDPTINNTMITNGLEFQDLTFLKSDGNSSVTSLIDDFTVNGDLVVDDLDPSAFSILPSGTRTIHLKGNFFLSKTSGTPRFGSDALFLEMSGSVDQTISRTGGEFRAVLLLNTANVVSPLNDFVTIGDAIINIGTLSLGAFNITIGDLFTQNGGGVTSTTGIFESKKFDLQAGIFDPFKAISNTTLNTILFTDGVGMSVMPSGGEFEFTGSNHWTIDQNFTEFTNLIINKCPTCNQTGNFYTKDLTLKNNTKWGGAFIRGNVYSDGFSIAPVTFAQTFDGVGDQTINGNVYFGRLQFNKISGSVLFNDDFRVTQCEVIAGADFVDFNSKLCHILNSGGHLLAVDWIVTGLLFGSIDLDVSTGGFVTMNNTVCLLGFTITTCTFIAGNISVGGDVTVNDTTVSDGIELTLNGVSDQNIFVANGDDTGLDNQVIVNKSSGSVIQQSNIGSSTLDFFLLRGVWCTNEFDFDALSLIITNTDSELQKTPLSTVTVTGSTTGTITNVSECGKKNSILAIL